MIGCGGARRLPRPYGSRRVQGLIYLAMLRNIEEYSQGRGEISCIKSTLLGHLKTDARPMDIADNSYEARTGRCSNRKELRSTYLSVDLLQVVNKKGITMAPDRVI